MNKSILKSQLVRDKEFLRQIYSGPNLIKNKRVLTSASDNELNTLLRYLFFVTNGDIQINAENFAQIKKMKKISLLHHKLSNKADFQNFINGPRMLKIDFILKLSSALPYLMYGLFNLENKLKAK